MKLNLATAAVAICCASFAAGGPWVLDNDASRISFVSTKAGHVAEVHRFRELSGIVTESGEVNVAIELASVDTLIPIRDERMREMLFVTNVFPTARLTSSIDVTALDSMAVGATQLIAAELALRLRGKMLSLTTELVVVRLDDDRMLVTTRQPVIVNASDVDLVDGVEVLRQIAGLPSISHSVPVTAILTFTSVEDG